MDTASQEEEFDARMAFRKAKRAKKDAQGGGEHESREKNEPSGEGGARNSIDRRTGERNRCYSCVHRRVHRTVSIAEPLSVHRKRTGMAALPPPYRQGKNPPSKPYSSIAMKTPVEVGGSKKLAPAGPARSRENSFSTTQELAPNRIVRLRSMTGRRRIWFVINGWEIVIYFCQGRALRRQRPIPPQRASSLGMAGMVR